MSAARSAVALAIALLTACAPSPASQIEDDSHPVQPNIPAAPLPPAVVAPAIVTPCSDGWRPVAGRTVAQTVTCEPWPEGGAKVCPDDSAHFPGTPGCTLIGAACPAGEWPEGLPADAPILYVRAGIAAGGSGTPGAPFGSIAAAVAASSPGTIIALGKGRFAEPVRLTSRLTLWGACAGQTVLASTAPGSAPMILVESDGVVVRNLQVASDRAGVWIHSGSGVQLRELLISSARLVGVLANGGAKVSGSRIVIRNTRPISGTNDFGQGLEAAEGAQVDLQWVVISGNRYVGALSGGAGSLIKLADAAVTGTQVELSSGLYGQGLHANNLGRIEGNRVVVEGNHTAGLNAETGGQLVVTDAVVRNSLGTTATTRDGFGGFVSTGGTLGLHRALVDHNRADGVRATGANSVLDISDTVVRDTQGTTQAQGSGVVASDQSSVKGSRVAIENNHRVGLSAQGAKTVVEVDDLTVRGTDGNANELLGGQGVVLFTGAHLTIRRALIEENQCNGIASLNDGSLLTLFDVTVRGTRGCLADGLGGQGLVVQSGSHLIAARLLFEHNRSAAVLADGSTTRVELSDVVASDTVGEQTAGDSYSDFGEALHAQRGAQVDVTRAIFERSHEIGIAATFAARITGTNIVVRQTLKSQCQPPRCLVPAGIGVAAIQNGSIDLTTFLITQSAQLGVEVATGGTADLQLGEISDNPIGVNVQTKDFDPGRVQRGVIFRNNAQTLNSELLPLPSLEQTLH